MRSTHGDEAGSGPRTARIGAVAIGRNEGDRLRRCLASLAAHGLPIVYVDSNSTDGSADHARAQGVEVVMLDPDIPFTAARARNEGWRRLREIRPDCDLIQFVDGDCELEDGWIAAATDFLATHDDVALVCGRRRERFPDASFYNRVCDEEWNTPVGEAAATGGDFLARTAMLEAVGGFDASLMAGEEPEMCSRIRGRGGRIWRIDAPMTIHDAAMTRFGQWWRRAIRSGAGYAQAWRATAAAPDRLYARELRRAVIWAGAVPLLAIVLAVALHPLWLLFAPAAWGLQIVRLSRTLGWRKAALFMAGKAAELYGVIHWMRQSLFGAPRHAVTYK